MIVATKKIYTESIRKLHQTFNKSHLEENPVSLTTFFNLKPFYCLKPIYCLLSYFELYKQVQTFTETSTTHFLDNLFKRIKVGHVISRNVGSEHL